MTDNKTHLPQKGCQFLQYRSTSTWAVKNNMLFTGNEGPSNLCFLQEYIHFYPFKMLR